MSQQSFSGFVKLFLLFSIWNYSYYYFFPFEQGVSAAPAYFFLIKYFLWLVLLFFLLVSRRVTLRHDLIIVLFVFFVLLIVLHLTHATQYGNAKHVNDLANLAFFIGILLVIHEDEANWFFDHLPLHLAVQVAISSLLLFVFDIHLWIERSIIGAFGNANSFGLALNIAFFWVLSKRERFSPWRLVLLLLLAGGILLTRSGSQAGVMFLGLLWLALTQLSRHAFRIAVLVACAVVGVIVAWQLEYLDRNMLLAAGSAASQLLDAVGIEVGSSVNVESRSVSLRKEIHLMALNFLQTAGVTESVFGSYSNDDYYRLDSQYLMFVMNYGLVGLLLFLSVCFWMFLTSLNVGLRQGRWFAFAAVMAFLVTFLFSRVLYYFPLNLIFFMLAIHLTAEARRSRGWKV